MRQSRFTGSPDFNEKWSFEAADSIYSTPAIGADGTVYVGSYDGNLYALYSQSGKLKWRFETGGAIASSPAIGADGTIYIGSGDGILYALDPEANDEHREKWSFATKGSVHASPVIGADGTIYIGSYDGKMYALNPNADDDEREIWSYKIGGRIDSSPAIGADGIIYVGSGDSIFYALDPAAEESKRVKWTVNLNMEFDGLCWDELCPIYSSPVIAPDGAAIYVGSYDGNVYALDPNADDDAHRVKWSFDTWGSVLSSPAIGEDGTVYVGAEGGVFFALNPDAAHADDRVKWTVETSAGPWMSIISSPVIGADGMIYFGSGNRKVYALDPDASRENRVKWSFATGGEIYSSPVIGPDGTIYIGSYDHKLYAVGAKVVAIPGDLAAIAHESAVKLAWEAVDGAAGYKVYQYEGAAAPVQPYDWVLVSDNELITETEYTVRNLTAGQLYWLTVQAVDAAGMESELSEPVSEMPYTNVTEVDDFAPIRVAKWVQLDELSLPEEAHVRLADGSELELPVSWDLANTDYSPEQAGDYTITGELRLEAHIRNPELQRAELAVSVLPSNEAKLRDIQLNGETLQSFKPEIYTYSVSYPYEIGQVTVSATAYDPDAVYEIIGGSTQLLQVGSNPLEIVVTAENGDTQTYNVNVVRDEDAAAPVWPPGSELNVSDITQTSVKLTWPEAADNAGVNGYRIYVDGMKRDTVSDNIYEANIDSLTANTEYTFEVTAFDAAGNESAPGLSRTVTTMPNSSSGSDHSGGGWYLSSNANLKSLEIREGGTEVHLSPTFAANTLAYTAVTKANQIELKAVADHAASKVMWQDRVLDDAVRIELQDGKNKIQLEVQAEDDSRQTYTLLIERIAPDPVEPELPVNPVADIAGHWAEAYIKRAMAEGIVSGYPDGTFKPDDPITRAEFTVMLAGALNLDGNGAALAFTDHEQIDSWAKPAIAQAVQAGLIDGYVDGSFRPNAQITRAETAVMIARALQLPLSTSAPTTGFADDETIPAWARSAIEAVRQMGIINGRGGNRFIPNGTTTRAEAVVMLLRSK